MFDSFYFNVLLILFNLNLYVNEFFLWNIFIIFIEVRMNQFRRFRPPQIAHTSSLSFIASNSQQCLFLLAQLSHSLP